MKIYVIGQGEYSDFCIDAVFSSQKLAQDYADKILETGETATVEELELDDTRLINSKLYTKYRSVIQQQYNYHHQHVDIIQYSDHRKYLAPDDINYDLIDTETHFCTDYRSQIIIAIITFSIISAEDAKEKLEQVKHLLGTKKE